MLNDNNHDFPDTINKDVIKKSKKIFNDYESFYSTGLNRLLEVLFVSFIFSKSKHYRKILIWYSSGLGYHFRFYNDRIEISDNGYIMHKSIHLISTRELQIEEPEKGNTFTFGKDKRNNHMSYENHIIFAKQVNDFLSTIQYLIIQDLNVSAKIDQIKRLQLELTTFCNAKCPSCEKS